MHIRFSTAFAIVMITSVGSAALRADPAEPDQSAAAAKAAPPSVTVISSDDARGVLGREVRSAADEDMGRIVDIVVDKEGKPRAAIIDFGGFLGVGSRKIAVDWAALKFGKVAKKEDKVTLALTRDQVRAAPEYKDDQLVVVLGASGKLSPLEFGPEK
ncbi:PRC-barrel domain-containing protein [Rhodopseudomonas pseudopalustris]|uniref:PRC-barrel n=2 Tax=Rhodopseudomonas TaxID=1073 RepID=Q13C07_RHOPS|nr:PRC-barrel domain-containing protein [Rhodopseudomonas pseudopalustris]ABE38382.1 PRC-barrel [Rhodopseudomonas palustris BisB5]SEO29949.1 PRC-barrel domain-containing protein [Rhodopseudomonas pseudopalustris]